jgi:hypothetical protein
MKKYLLSEAGTFYRANLHCHTTCSDGRTTPEETKEAYKNEGYSIIAFTDHRNFINHNDLTDDTFLALNGFEADISEPTPGGWSLTMKTCHLCAIALDEKTDSAPSCLGINYDGESISAYIKACKDAGFFVTYNHPTWSLESYPEYMSYKGADALEIINYGCVCEGFNDRNEHAYDDMLRSGERLYVVGADDNHGRSQFFGGYTMIKAESLTYKDIAKSLKDGNFYASEGGPKIEELYIEDGHICVKTDSAREIFLSSDRRICSRIKASEAKIPIREYDYFRITAVGQDGKCSWTRAYFTDTL